MSKRFYTRNLPHWQPEGVIFAVNFRLSGSLPQPVIDRLKSEREQKLNKISQQEAAYHKAFPKELPLTIQLELEKKKSDAKNPYLGKFNDLLDGATFGPTWLVIPEIATIVKETIHYIEKEMKLYRVLAYCIMPNHVHMIVSEVKLVLHQVLKKLKQFSAKESNKILNRTGHPFWQKESYDHIIRSERELSYQITYVMNNPVSAGLVENWDDWKFSYCSADFPVST